MDLKTQTSLTISLAQKNEKYLNDGKADPFVGFEIYDFFKGRKIFSSNLKSAHDVTKRIVLPKGRYQVVPNIVNGNGEFHLRIFSNKKRENNCK